MSLASATSTTTTGEVFLQNDYVSIGINAQGTLGTIARAPTGFNADVGHGYARVGFYADVDGFGRGAASTMRDAILPGTAIETFSIGYSSAGKQSVNTNSGLDGKKDIVGTNTNTSTAKASQSTWTGSTADKVGVTQVATISPDAQYVKFEVTLTNSGSSAISDVRYLRSIDPDLNPSSYATYNKIVLQGDGKAMVTASAGATGTPMFLYAADTRASVSIYGYENFTPYDEGVLKGQSAGYVNSSDISLNLNFNIGTLLAGQSTTITFYLGMTNDLAGIVKAIDAGSPPPTDPEPVPTNHAPAAAADKFNGNAGSTITGNVLANDGDVDGDKLSASVATGPANGTLKLNADGTFTYVANAGFSGTDSFTYKVSDGKLSSTATVTIDVNGKPQGVADSANVNAGSSVKINVLANDTDPDGQELKASLVTGPSNGTLTLNADGTFTYTPKAGFSGTDSFTYKASDGSLSSDPVTVKVNVNGGPKGADDSAKVNAGSSVSGNVLTNDSDPNGDKLSTSLVSNTSNGTLKLNADGSYTYTPNAGFSGTDSFTYKVSDGKLTDTATVTIDVNGAPVAKADTLSVISVAPGIGNVLANDVDPNGDTLTVSLVTGPQHGTLKLNADGTYVYIADAGFTGTDSFTYKASDGSLSGNATVAITVNPIPITNKTPDAVNDRVAVTAGASVAGNVLANDTDPDGDTLTAALVSGPANGTLKLNADGTFTYTPNAGFSGTDSFTYKASDGKASDAATVAITVNPAPNAAPVARDDAALVQAGKSVSGNVLANDTDADGNSLSAALVTGPKHGTLTLNADGSYVYQADEGYSGTDTFTYRASDGKATANAVVNLTVKAPDPKPEPTGILDKIGTIDLTSSDAQYVTGASHHNAFYINSDGVSGKDTITNFGKDDVLILKTALYDSNNDGFIYFKNNTLDVDGSKGADTLKMTGVSVVRDMGTWNGMEVYANGSVRPNGAIESKIGDDILKGDKPDNSKQIFFFDTALDIDLGNDTITNFGNRDIIVTTSALKLAGGTKLVDFGGDHLLDLVGGSGSPEDRMIAGEAGHVSILNAAGANVTGLEFDGSIAGVGVTYYVYSNIGSAAGVGDLTI